MNSHSSGKKRNRVCGFESHRVDESLSIVSIVCCKVEVSATS
jgi:hypothetical protein